MKNTNTLHGQNSLSSVIVGGIYNNQLPLLDNVFLVCTMRFSINKGICKL